MSKRYWKIQERSLLRALVPFGGPNRTRLDALSDVDLVIEHGETVGVIGRNGAGKSTLLRLLAGVSQPSSGTISIRGRIAPLLSLGVGFHHEMTGRENVFVNGMLLGLSKRQVSRRLDRIVAFADIEEFVDTPVKFYSSGMLLRLGFSVAVNADPGVLLVDEVLGVGDLGFQQRCYERMRELQREGTTIVFVSHWLHIVQQLCPRVVVLQQGRVAFDGMTEAGIARYHDFIGRSAGDAADDDARVVVVDRRLERVDGGPVEILDQDTELLYTATLRFEEPIDDPQVYFRVLAEDGTVPYMAGTPAGQHWRSFRAGEETTVRVTFRPSFGGGGSYRIAMFVTDNDASLAILHDQAGPSFYIPARPGVIGVADLGAQIEVDGQERAHARLRLDQRPTTTPST